MPSSVGNSTRYVGSPHFFKILIQMYCKFVSQQEFLVLSPFSLPVPLSPTLLSISRPPTWLSIFLALPPCFLSFLYSLPLSPSSSIYSPISLCHRWRHVLPLYLTFLYHFHALLISFHLSPPHYLSLFISLSPSPSTPFTLCHRHRNSFFFT